MTRQLRYFGQLIRSVFFGAAVGRRRMRALIPAALLLLAGGFAAVRVPAFALGNVEAKRTALDVLMARAAEVDRAFALVDRVYEEEIAPIERVLLHYRDDTTLARRIATSLVREGRRAGLEPDLLLAVLLVENPMLQPTARSSVGAVGLMQVMPFHDGQWKQCSGDLEQIETNICYGAQIFKENLRSTKGDLERALLRYNGCVRGTNTPNCGLYPMHVYARAGRASILAKVSTHSAP